MLVFWTLLCIDVEVGKNKNAVASTTVENTDKSAAKTIPLALGMVMIAIIAMGMLRDGVTTWMPSYISEVYNLGNIIAILTGVVLPILGFVCFQSASIIYTKKLHNPIITAAIFFIISVVASLSLFITSGMNAALSVVLFAILAGCMHGVNMMLICTVPRYFKKSGKVSTVSGVLNACTYVGSALSTYGIAAIASGQGWSTTLLILFILAAGGTLLTVLSALPWYKAFGNREFE